MNRAEEFFKEDIANAIDIGHGHYIEFFHRSKLFVKAEQ